MTSDLKSATLITLVSMCILPPRASNGLLGHSDPQTVSEVRSDLKIQLSDLNYICSHVSLASKGLHELNPDGGGQTTPIDFVSSTEVKRAQKGHTLLLYTVCLQ